MNIQLIMTIVLLVIMGVSILVGLLQGVKKNTYGLLFTILFWVFFWITSPLAKGTNFWYSESKFESFASSFGIDLSSASCMMDYVKGLLAENLNFDAAALADPAFDNTIIAIGMCVFKIGYLIILAIIFAIIKVVVYRVVIKRLIKFDSTKLARLNEQQAKYVEEHQEENQKINNKIKFAKFEEKAEKLNKPLGLASGFLRGALSCFLILCVVNSMVRMLPEDKENVSVSTEATSENTSIYDFILSYTNNDPTVAEAIQSIKEYQKSGWFALTSLKLGKRTTDELFIDSILSGKSKDYSFALRKEIKSVVKIAEEAFYLTNGFDMENVDWANLSSSQIKNLQNIIVTLSDDDLVRNLGSSLVGIAISLDAVAPYMPENLSEEEYKNINWSEELKTIAVVVENVYGLGDLSSINYLDLDPNAVEKLVISISNLKSINFLAHVGLSYSIKSLITENESLELEINSIEQKLANLATSNGFSETIYSYADLYRDFTELFTEVAFDKFKDEEGVINYIAALTSIDTTKYSSIVSTILHSNFVSEVLPDVLTIIRETIIPEEFASIINPNVLTSTQWENEINTVLKIVNDLTTDPTTKQKVPFETIQKYDFSLLKNFTPETVVQSELLSFAMIKILVDASKNEGVLSSETSDISNFICVPDYLTTANSDYRFNDKWYGNAAKHHVDGELYIILSTIKNCAANLESIENSAESLPAVINAINANQIINSDVLYYSLNNLIKSINNLIIIPVSETETSPYTVNDESINIIKREPLREVIDIISNKDIINLENMFAYFKVNEDGTISETPVDEKVEGENYVVKLDFSTNKLLSLLTSETLYDPANNNDINLTKLFNSDILRATITHILSSYTEDLIVVPKSAVASSTECYVLNEDGETETINVDVIKVEQFKSLIMAISDLEIDVENMISNPSSIIDAFVENNKIKVKAKNVLTETNSKYSSILHATISKFIIDFANDDDSLIVVPTEVLSNQDENLIVSEELIKFIEALAIIGTDVLDDSTNNNEIIDIMLEKVIEHNEVLDSLIIRATLSDYLTSGDVSIEIPNDAYDTSIASVKVIKQEHIIDLLEAVDALKTVSKNSSYSELLDPGKLSVNTIKSAESLKGNPISNSLLLRSLLTEKLVESNIVIPHIAKEKEVLTVEETHNLIISLEKILGNSTLNNLDFDGLTLKAINTNKSIITESIIVRNIISEKLISQGDVLVIPSYSYDYVNEDIKIIKKQEIVSLISCLSIIVNENSSLDRIPTFTNVNVDTIKNNIDTVSKSLIVRATISEEMIDTNTLLIIPQRDVESAIKDHYVLTEESFVDLFNVLSIMDINDMNNISLDEIVVKSTYSSIISESSIIRAIITNNMKVNDKSIYSLETDVEVLYDINGEKIIVIKQEEIKNLIDSISLLSSDGKLEVSIDIDTLKKNFNSLNFILNSNVVRIAISEVVIDYAGTAVNPSRQSAYKIPDASAPLLKKILTKEDIIVYIRFLTSF